MNENDKRVHEEPSDYIASEYDDGWFIERSDPDNIIMLVVVGGPFSTERDAEAAPELASLAGNTGGSMTDRWIPVTERLPEESGWYLVAWEDLINLDPHQPKVDFFHSSIGEWETNHHVSRVIAWMPIPPYEQTEERSKWFDVLDEEERQGI